MSHVISVELGEGTSADGFRRYVDAVAHELAALGWQLPRADVVVHSSVPIGAGLSSSAALCVATATMFEALTGKQLSPIEKAKLCQRAEHRAGTPCGIMDMFVATHAREGCAMLLDCRSLECEHVPLPGAKEMVLFVVNTGVRHELADGGAYAERRASCASAACKLGRPALRDVTEAELAEQATVLSETELRRARHVVTENARTLHAVAALRKGDLKALGRLMFDSHDSLAGDFEVSCAELDAVVALVRDHHPRLGFGARMTGAGFGGSAIVLCCGEHAADIPEIMGEILQAQFGRHFNIVRALPGRASACQLGSEPR
jgi:galactokinase